MPFIYFLPKEQRKGLSDETLPACLAHLAGGTLSFRTTGAGPEGAGLLLCVDGHPDYLPKQQTWRKMPGAECWIGYAALPGPLELRRRDLRLGATVKLADGNDWLIPVARKVVEGPDGQRMSECQLPRRRRQKPQGGWERGEVVAQYAGLWEACEAWWNKKYAILGELAQDTGAGVPLSLDEETGAAVRVLSANYRVGPAECDLLGVFDDAAVMAVLDALCDLVSFDLLAAKKAPAAPRSPAVAA